MQHKYLRFGNGFEVVLGDELPEAARMTLAPGDTEVGQDNRHEGADQWPFFVSGEGLAIVEAERVDLQGGTLVPIKRGERHEIRDTSGGSLRTLDDYMPPV